MTGRRFKGAFEPGFPEMSEADWAALEKSHREESVRRERDWQKLFREMRDQEDADLEQFRERERKMMQRTRRELGLASELLRVAKSLIANLNGMKKPQAVKFVNGLLYRHTQGFFRDEDWSGVKRGVWDVLDGQGIDYTITSSEYIKESASFPRGGMPTAKQWKFEILFQNDKGKMTTLYGVVTASGAGSVEDPLEKYDIVAYVG